MGADGMELLDGLDDDPPTAKQLSAEELGAIASGRGGARGDHGTSSSGGSWAVHLVAAGHCPGQRRRIGRRDRDPIACERRVAATHRSPTEVPAPERRKNPGAGAMGGKDASTAVQGLVERGVTAQDARSSGTD